MARTQQTATDHSRREFLQGTAAVAGAMLAPSATHAAPPAPATQRKRPNLVFFLGEGQRADALSLMNHPLLKTPNHDRIGREGAHFQNAFCTNALCAPARTVALTGMYSRSTGSLSNERLRTEGVPKDIPLFTDILRDAGYEIALVGKTHGPLGFQDRNWDYYFGHNDPGNHYNNPVFREGRKGNVGPDKQYTDVYPDDLTVDRALAWLDEDRGDKPFCLLVWFVAPHEPFFRPRRHLDLFNGAPVAKPATFDDDLKGWPGKPKAFTDCKIKVGTTDTHAACASLEGMAKDYFAGLVAVDDNIGRILSWLEKKNILNDTAILHTSDHGYFLGEWRLFDKRFMHEPSIRVPMMLRYPSRIPSGTVRSEMVLDIDIAPTMLDLAGLPIPAHMQGKSFLPVVQHADPHFRNEWYYEFYEWPHPSGVHPHRGIRTETHKLIHYTTTPPQFEMYDLSHDPGETRNLYGDPGHAKIQEHLHQRLEALRSSVPERKTSANRKSSPEADAT